MKKKLRDIKYNCIVVWLIAMWCLMGEPIE
jgi:hypothetical protein